jgi:hypothetical protein
MAHTYKSSTPTNLRQRDLKFKAKTEYIVRPCLKKQTKKEEKEEKKAKITDALSLKYHGTDFYQVEINLK